MKINTKSLLPYWLALGIISIVLLVMFYPALQGKIIQQGDIESHKGMSKEIADYYEQDGEQAFWTNAMFGGMPSYLISMHHNSNLLLQIDKLLMLYLPFFMGFVFLIFAGFYFLSQVLKIDPWIAVIGALAFVLSSYFVIILAAGHNSKAHAIAYMAPFLAALYMTYKGKYLLGGLLAAVFLAFEIGCNHLQITYYLAFMALIFVLFEFVWAFKDKQFKRFIIASSVMVFVAIIAVAINFSLLYTTYDYSKETIRGKSELASKNIDNKTDGLETDYLTAWSYGVGETWSLMIPNVKGGVSQTIQEDNKHLLKEVSPQLKQMIGGWSQYWGDQPFTSGPVYVGAVVMFLFVFSLFLVRDRLKWPLLLVGLLSVLLAWGKHFPGLTDFFINHVPLYNKFRAPAMWLVVVEIIIPIIMLMGLHQLIVNRDKYEKKLNWLYISFGLTGGVALLFWLMPATFFSFISAQDQQYFDMFISQGAQQAQIDDFAAELVNVRISIFKADAIRTFLFILAAGIASWVFMKKKINKQAFISIVILLIAIDMIPVNKRYLKESNFISKRKYETPFVQTPADQMILQDNVQDARVLNLAVNTFNDASTSYFHKSVGGYHAAKLMRYQELIENQISPEISMLSANLNQETTMGRIDTVLSNLGVLNMLNTKYLILDPNAAPLINRHALGHAWFVSSVLWVQSSDEEIQRVGEINPSIDVVVDKRYASVIDDKSLMSDSSATISRLSYSPNEVTYSSSSSTDQFAVFSEIYYPEWELTIDGQPAELIRVDYVLRGAVIPAGSHEIIMTMNPKTYNMSSNISLISSLILILAILAYIGREIMLKRKKEIKDVS